MRKFLALIPLFAFYSVFCQNVGFKGDSIYISGKPCLLYKRMGNDFIIYKLDSSKLIEGSVENVGPNTFKTTYHFPTIDRKFSNPKINGRNALIFALVQNKILAASGELDAVKLVRFIEKYNEGP
ncbi:MAG TPA: hypothetical protein VGM31_19900 [Puia sp.]|jgi:hypothetical protein